MSLRKIAFTKVITDEILERVCEVLEAHREYQLMTLLSRIPPRPIHLYQPPHEDQEEQNSKARAACR